MAKFIFARIFLFALLFFSHGIRFTEEVRVLKAEKADEYYSGNQITETLIRFGSRNKINSSRGLYEADHDAPAASAKFTAFENYTDDIHPTNPGHSPSVGHSTPPDNH